jgi:hypothetical protein
MEKEMTAQAIPDARQDMLGMLNALAAEIISLRSDVAAIKGTIRIRESYTIEDLASRYHCSRSTFHSCPWRLPNFGRPDFGESPRRWWIETLETWEAVAESEHRDAWEMMSAGDRCKMLGISA